MGLHDRDYVRDELPPESAPVRLWKQYPRTLIFLAFLTAWQFVQFSRSSNFGAAEWREMWWLSSESLRGGRLWILITASFLHEQVLHLALNGVALAWFCGVAEREKRYGWIYLAPVFGMAGNAGAMLVAGTTLLPTVGAEGMVLGIGCGLMVHKGRTEAARKALRWPLMIAVMVLSWRVIHTGAYWPMMGLMLAGAAGVGLSRLLLQRAIRAEERRVSPTELDALLERVSQVGMDGLSEHERSALDQASAEHRRRRGW